jgi:rhodanese-related sulfurtransferase
MGTDIGTDSIWTWVLPIALGLILGLLLALRKKYDYSQVILLKPEDFRANMRKGQLIDVRRKDEYDRRRINGSRNFPKMSIFASLYKMRKDQPIFLYDTINGLLLKRVSHKLIRKGFHPVYVLETGLEKYPFPLKEE